MKKHFNILILLNILTSCSYHDICYEHHDVNEKIHIIDENNIYHDTIYIKDDYLEEYDCKQISFYSKETDLLLSKYNIFDYNFFNPKFIIDDYYFYGKYIEDYIEYSYFDMYIQSKIATIKIKKDEKFLTFNNKKYLVGKNGVLYKVDYGVTQSKYFDNEKFGFYNEVYTSLENDNDIFITDIHDKKIVLKNYYDESIMYSYDINPILADYKYYKKTNFVFLDAFYPEEETENSYYIDPDSFVLLEDNNLYFSYSRYLGDYEFSDCSDYQDCLFSRKGSEILRFNNETKKIEQVALVPESYSVLKIYLDRAYVMDNKGIACLYFKDNKFEYVYECDMKQYYTMKFNILSEEQDINIKIYFENKEFISFKNDINYLASIYHFRNKDEKIDYVH